MPRKAVRPRPLARRTAADGGERDRRDPAPWARPAEKWKRPRGALAGPPPGRKEDQR
jgi:hypothetical protein